MTHNQSPPTATNYEQIEVEIRHQWNELQRRVGSAILIYSLKLNKQCATPLPLKKDVLQTVARQSASFLQDFVSNLLGITTKGSKDAGKRKRLESDSPKATKKRRLEKESEGEKQGPPTDSERSKQMSETEQQKTIVARLPKVNRRGNPFAGSWKTVLGVAKDMNVPQT